MPENNGPSTSRDIYVGQRIDDIGNRVSELREVVSRSVGGIHARIDSLPADMRQAVLDGTAPVVAAMQALRPPRHRWWERRPWDLILVLMAIWLLVIGTGAAGLYGLVPKEMMRDLWQITMRYVAADGMPGDVLASPAGAAPRPPIP